MREYARRETALLIGRLSQAVDRAAQTGDADSIHDVRVALRRLSRCLQVFASFYPRGSWKKIRRRMAGLMTAAGVVRDCDIAVDLARRAGFLPRSVLLRRLAAERRRSGHALLVEIRLWKNRDLIGRWEKRLEL